MTRCPADNRDLQKKTTRPVEDPDDEDSGAATGKRGKQM